MTDTPLAERTRLVLWGLRNAGKSSLLNRLLGQEASIVSPVPGTTTDPVTRTMELLPLGPVALTDTAGLDDEAPLGPARIAKTERALDEAHIALWVSRADAALHPLEVQRLEGLQSRGLVVVAAFTHGDRGLHPEKAAWLAERPARGQVVENPAGRGHESLLRRLADLSDRLKYEITPLEGLVQAGDLVILVTPIDLAAPKGRLILPQVETLRDALDRDCAALVVKERELGLYRDLIGRSRLVVCDSQAFAKVSAELPPDTPLTSFSLLFARKKADLGAMVPSLGALEATPPQARILIWEACRHHRQADDLATVKIPRLYQSLYQPDVTFEITRDWPGTEALKAYHLILACGSCSVTRQRMSGFLDRARQAGVPVLNYGLFLAAANGLIPRALKPFPEWELWQLTYCGRSCPRPGEPGVEGRSEAEAPSG